MACDTGHVTCDTWREVNILSKFQVPGSYGLEMKVSWGFGGKGSLNEWMNELINDCGVCRTPGLLNIASTSFFGYIVLFIHKQLLPNANSTHYICNKEKLDHPIEILKLPTLLVLFTLDYVWMWRIQSKTNTKVLVIEASRANNVLKWVHHP